MNVSQKRNILKEKVSFKERYYDAKSKRHKWKNVNGILIGVDEKTGNCLIQTDEGIIQRTNFNRE